MHYGLSKRCTGLPGCRAKTSTNCNRVQLGAFRRGRHLRLFSSTGAALSTGGDGGLGGGRNDSSGGGGGGGGDKQNPGGGGLDPSIIALLTAAGRSVDSFAPDFAKALAAGKVSAEILKRYLELESKFFIGWLMSIGGFRERLLADPSFLVKVAIEVGIGVFTKVSAEYTKRGDAFWPELDYVGANVVMAIIADFMLVWLPAPTLAFRAGGKPAQNPLTGMFAGCPENAFQKVQSGMEPFTVGQRFGAVVRNGLKLFGVGLSASFIGVLMTNALTALRIMLDPSFTPLNPPQDVLQTSAAYGVYMATSSNLRYQILAGVVEERGIETWFKGNYQLCAVLSFIVRTSNTFIGSLLWVDFVRLLGMQSASSH